MKPSDTFRNLYLLCLLFLVAICYSQSNVYGEGPVNWELRKPYEMPPEAEKYAAYDLVVLSDQAEFQFYSVGGEKLIRNIRYKINTQKGLEELRHYEMPESFDFGFDMELYRQSRRSRIKIPYVRDFHVKVFAARKFSRQRWANVTVKERYEAKRWMKSTGEFSSEDMIVFDLGTLAVGDVLELYYEASFDAHYGANLFYFSGPYPKLTCEYAFVYRMDKTIKETSYMLPLNLDPVKPYSSRVDYGNYSLITTRIQLSDVAANTYPLNSFEARKLPHVFADFSYYRSIVKYVDKTYMFSKSVRPRTYEWSVAVDTTSKEQVRIYDKQFTAIRKFVSTLPPGGTDSGNAVFLKALCDTLNNCRYISANHLYYNESPLYELYSGEHLLKRRLTGNALWKVYTDILKENRLFYYQVNLQDKRFGEHEQERHIHFGYEHNLIALPLNSGFVYLMPRYEGARYHLNELPFYLEDAMAAFLPVNIQHAKNKGSKGFRMQKTSASSFKDNVRTEDATVQVALDSLSARISIKEGLSGQFSTLLRPLYLNEYIDSTVSPLYFRKCLDKPAAFAKKTKLASKQTVFPFRYEFECSAKLAIKDSSRFSLQNWFSFVLSGKTLSKAPTHDYYFDFDMQDAYQLRLEFNRPIAIKNRALFARTINNEFFELESSIEEEKGTSYLLKIRAVVKQKSIPKEKAELLMDFVAQLDQLNNFTLELAGN